VPTDSSGAGPTPASGLGSSRRLKTAYSPRRGRPLRHTRASLHARSNLCEELLERTLRIICVDEDSVPNAWMSYELEAF
jgi:hypothetical protein